MNMGQKGEVLVMAVLVGCQALEISQIKWRLWAWGGTQIADTGRVEGTAMTGKGYEGGAETVREVWKRRVGDAIMTVCGMKRDADQGQGIGEGKVEKGVETGSGNIVGCGLHQGLEVGTEKGGTEDIAIIVVAGHQIIGNPVANADATTCEDNVCAPHMAFDIVAFPLGNRQKAANMYMN